MKGRPLPGPCWNVVGGGGGGGAGRAGSQSQEEEEEALREDGSLEEVRE